MYILHAKCSPGGPGSMRSMEEPQAPGFAWRVDKNKINNVFWQESNENLLVRIKSIFPRRIDVWQESNQ